MVKIPRRPILLKFETLENLQKVKKVFCSSTHRLSSQAQHVCTHSTNKHLLVSKPSSRDVVKTSEDILSVTIFCRPRRLKHVLQRYLQDVLKNKKLTLKTSSRRLGDQRNVYWDLYLTNLNLHLANLYLTNLYITNLFLSNLFLTNLYLTNLRRIQDKSKMHYKNSINSIVIAFFKKILLDRRYEELLSIYSRSVRITF